MKNVFLLALICAFAVFGSVTVITPNGGEILNRGSQYEISWNDSFPEAVKLELYDNDIFYSSIIDSTDSDGSYIWDVPNNIFGSNYKIMISSSLFDTIIDESDSYFSIDKGSIILTTPQAGDIIEMYEKTPIVWTSEIPEDVKISLYKDTEMMTNITSKSSVNLDWNFYTENLIAGTDYKLKIESTLYSDLFAETGYFTIKGTNNINGSLSGVWSIENSPYILTGNSIVETMNTLTIDPGVKVKELSIVDKFDVQGNLVAKGEYGNEIKFENVNLEFNSTHTDTSKIVYSNFGRVDYFDRFDITFGNSTIGDYVYTVKQTSDGGYIVVGSYYDSFFNDGLILLAKINSNGFLSWEKTFDFNAPMANAGYDVEQTNDGGYMVAGTSPTNGGGHPNGGILLKTDLNGNLEWQKIYNVTEFDAYSTSLEETSDGGYITAGYRWSLTGTDLWLMKVDSNGIEEWSKMFGGSSQSDLAFDVKQTIDGGYIITGYTESYGAGLKDVWLIKTNSTGNEVWKRTFGGAGDDIGRSVQQTIDGGYIISGNTYSFGAGGSDVWLIKTDSLGRQVWNKTFGGTLDDEGYSLDQTTDGFIIAGYTKSYGAGFSDMWMIKTDTSGNEKWNNTFGGTGSDVGRSVQQTTDGGFILAGYTDSYGGTVDYNAWLIKTDPYGKKVINQTITINDNSKTVIQNCIINNINNYGIIVNNSSPVITNNLITNNNGGIKLNDSSPMYIVNNTIADNDSIGLYFDGNSDGQFVDNIVYGNKTKEIYIKSDLSDPSFFYNDIKGGQAGFGLYSGVTYSGTYANNINLNPLFVSDSYILSGSSPCIDMGYPGLTEELLGSLYIPQSDLSGNPRLYYNEVDMGCYECVTSGIENENNVSELELFQNYPNPFNPVTTIKYSIPNNSKVKLNIFDITGRELCTLVDQAQNKGYHEVKFNGDRLTSGIYFYRLSIDNKVVSNKKMMLMK